MTTLWAKYWTKASNYSCLTFFSILTVVPPFIDEINNFFLPKWSALKSLQDKLCQNSFWDICVFCGWLPMEVPPYTWHSARFEAPLSKRLWDRSRFNNFFILSFWCRIWKNYLEKLKKGWDRKFCIFQKKVWFFRNTTPFEYFVFFDRKKVFGEAKK